MHAHRLPEPALDVGVPCLESTLVQDTDREWQLVDTEGGRQTEVQLKLARSPQGSVRDGKDQDASTDCLLVSHSMDKLGKLHGGSV